MPLAPVAEVYLAGKNTILTLGSVTGLPVMDGSYKIETASDDMTNTLGAGWYDSVGTISKASGSIKIAYEATEPLAVVVGLKYAIAIDMGTGNPYLGGNVRILSVDVPALNVKGGIVQSFTWESCGAMVTVHP